MDPNAPQDTRTDAQVYSPPYLFVGDRPEVTDAPDELQLGVPFTVQTPQAADITKATLVRLSSVTHANNMSQRINVLPVEQQPQGLAISPPATAEQCPPGPYLLFLLDGQGVPSVARIVRVSPPPALPQPRRNERRLAMAEEPSPQSSRRPTPGDGGGRLVTVGVTGLCPYGIGPCWGRANEALWQLPGIAAVAAVPDVTTSTALIELPGRGLPPLQQWQTRFDELVAGSYALRGVEVTLTGALSREGEGVLLLGHGDEHSRIRLAPLDSTDIVQWDPGNQRPASATAAELQAYGELIASAPGRAVEVTGPLLQHDDGYLLEVRRYESRDGGPVGTASPSRRLRQETRQDTNVWWVSSFEIVDLTRGGLVTRGTHADAPAVVGSIDTEELARQIQALRRDLGGVVGHPDGGLGIESLVIKLTLGAEGRIAFIAKGSVEASIEVTFSAPRA